MLRRDERQERYATKDTKELRARLDELGVPWGLGLFPNVGTDIEVMTSMGEAVLYVATDGHKVSCMLLFGDSSEDAVNVLNHGLTVYQAARPECDMALDEAIEHCKEVAAECEGTECGVEHMQLAEWLREARGARCFSRWATEKINELKLENDRLRREDAR